MSGDDRGHDRGEPVLVIGETYSTSDLLDMFPGAMFVGFEDDLGQCECGKEAVTIVYNGMHNLPVCRECWNNPETIHMEALIEFNIHVLQAGHGGELYEELHDWMDPNQLLADLYESEWDDRNMPHPEWEEYTAWMNRASDLYNEWFAAERGKCSDCGREPAAIHRDSQDQRGEPICLRCVKGGAFDE